MDFVLHVGPRHRFCLHPGTLHLCWQHIVFLSLAVGIRNSIKLAMNIQKMRATTLQTLSTTVNHLDSRAHGQRACRAASRSSRV